MILLQASTKREFHAAVSTVVDAITQNGGWVVSHNFYSNALAMLSFMLPTKGFSVFEDTMVQAGIALHNPLPQLQKSEDEVSFQLSMSVLNDGPDVRRQVPAFG